MVTSLYQSVGAVDAVEWACELCGCCIQNDWVSRAMNLHQILCIKLEYSSAETIWMIQKATAMGNWWLAASSQQCACTCIKSFTEFFVKHQKTQPRWLSPSIAQIWHPETKVLIFPKTKITFEREEISDWWWDSGKYDRVADGDWENCVRSQGAYFGGNCGVIVLCTMFLVSSSINVSICHCMAGYCLKRIHMCEIKCEAKYYHTIR